MQAADYQSISMKLGLFSLSNALQGPSGNISFAYDIQATDLTSKQYQLTGKREILLITPATPAHFREHLTEKLEHIGREVYALGGRTAAPTTERLTELVLNYKGVWANTDTRPYFGEFTAEHIGSTKISTSQKPTLRKWRQNDNDKTQFYRELFGLALLRTCQLPFLWDVFANSDQPLTFPE